LDNTEIILDHKVHKTKISVNNMVDILNDLVGMGEDFTKIEKKKKKKKKDDEKYIFFLFVCYLLFLNCLGLKMVI
jgi:hypothetical protein